MVESRAQSWHQFHETMIAQLCPPFDAIAVGGSADRNSDQLSDLDFFLVAPDDEFLVLIRDFPRLLHHASPPVTERHRGYLTEFGYQFTYVYSHGRMVEYNLNCHATLTEGPMMLKNRVIKDRTGRYTELLQQTRRAVNTSADVFLRSLFAEYTVELIKFEKYALRRDWIVLNHRLERLRLLYLSLLRLSISGEQVRPHDSDKNLASLLPKERQLFLLLTFGGPEVSSIGLSFKVLSREINRLLADFEITALVHQHQNLLVEELYARSVKALS
jgi:hypothetical protein